MKPANIFLSKSSDAILGDFSIAKVLSGALAATQIGTPGYLAPEVWLGHRYGPRSDVFSLGCSIFEAAELQRAFSAMAAEVCRPCPLRRSAAALSDALRNLLRRMLEKTPRKRPGALEVLARVKAARSSSQDASHPKHRVKASHLETGTLLPDRRASAGALVDSSRGMRRRLHRTAHLLEDGAIFAPGKIEWRSPLSMAFRVRRNRRRTETHCP